MDTKFIWEICKYGKNANPLFNIKTQNTKEVNYNDGAINQYGNVMGTYIHGVFDKTDFREIIVNKLRSKKGLELKNLNLMKI